jgi:hypothetical protein
MRLCCTFASALQKQVLLNNIEYGEVPEWPKGTVC